MVGLFHVSQMCELDAVSREANQRAVRVSCGTIARSPIFMHLPAPILQTLCALCRLGYVSATAHCLQEDHSIKDLMSYILALIMETRSSASR
jgi:hypothetical protein